MKNHLLTWSVALLSMAALAACGGSKPTPTPTPSKDSEEGTSIVSSDSEEGTSEEGTSEEGTSEEGTSEEGTSEEETGIEVTFKIKVVNLGDHSLTVAGDFTSWGEGAIILDAEGEDVYSFKHTAEVGTKIEYKYVLDGNDWDTLNAANREFTFAEGVTEQDDGEYELTVIGDTDVTCTFSVDMTGIDLTDKNVYMCGGMNGWSASDDYKLTLGEGAVYSISLTEKEGVSYSFKFVYGVPGTLTWEDNIGNRSYIFDPTEVTYEASWDVA